MTNKQHKPACVCHRCLVTYFGILTRVVSTLERRVNYIEKALQDKGMLTPAPEEEKKDG